MEIKWQQQQGIKKEQGVSEPQKSLTEANFDTSEAAAIVQPKTRFLENLRRKLEEVEKEADEIRQVMAKLEKERRAAQDIVEGQNGGSVVAVKLEPKVEIIEPKEESDTRSIFVGNVDYACTAEEVQQHFQSCGTINRVTIMLDTFGQPKGFAYVEFMEVEAVQNALLLNESELRGRQLKVSVKRTNIPGMNHYRGIYPIPYYGYGTVAATIRAKFVQREIVGGCRILGGRWRLSDSE
ncbi:polyadenylate-binding protein [Striga asiatica]|uniref:Polyadenylate-binding protein n=1 Tax=Striga asiatica TaxID=4170 RepID=A0A5A7QYN5_STRAF|nr:polyadenylate-binding protein [Striga asiatica]